MRTIDNRIAFSNAGPVRIARVRASQRGVSLELKPDDPSRDHVHLTLQLSGESTYRQNQRILRLAPAQWAVCEVSELYIVSNLPGSAEQVVFLIPLDQVQQGPDIRDICFCALPSTEGLSKLLWHTASCVVEELDRGGIERLDALVKALVEVVRLAIDERRAAIAASLSTRDRMRRQIQEYIDSNLHDPMLSIDKIASQLKCTKRYLHRIFQNSGTSLRSYILQQRLDRCRSDLLNGALLTRSVTKIALSWGFNSVPHFNRNFRARFGLSPLEYRLRHQHEVGAGANSASVVEG